MYYQLVITIKTNKMKFLKKASKSKYFWLENYNEEQREFFINLGFTERIVKGFKGEIVLRSLSFIGSNYFGMWSDEEVKTIFTETRKKYGSFKVRTLTMAELI